MTTPSVRRVRRGGRRGIAGQSLAIFALCSLVLFGVVGLAIDAGVSYLAANQVERAAASAALAGVPYMPDQYSPSAVQAGKQAAARNGFVDGQNGVVVKVYRVPVGCDAGGSDATCIHNRLGASVSVPVSNTFIAVLGFPARHAVTQTATAEFLNTLTLGQPNPFLGSTKTSLGTGGNNYYVLRFEGWNVDRQHGDAYTPNPSYGSSDNPDGCTACYGTGNPVDVHTLHGGDETPMTAPFTALPSRGGYSYQVTVPAGQTAHIQVYNPAFAPGPGGENSTNYYENTYNLGDRTTYSAVEYTLLQVNDQFDHRSDTPLSQVVVHPVNNTSGNVVDQMTGHQLTATTASTWVHNWVDIANPGLYSTAESSGTNEVDTHRPYSAALGPGTYRLRLDLLDWQGRVAPDDASASLHSDAFKNVALQVTQSDESTLCSTCTVGAINELSVYTPVNAGSFNIPIVRIPPEYAGQTVKIFVYDPGDIGGGSSRSNTLSILNPYPSLHIANTDVDPTNASSIGIYDNGIQRDVTPSTLVNSEYPGAQANASKASVQTIVNNTNVFNSKWLLYEIPVPTNYAPSATNVPSQYWYLQYATNVTAADTITLGVGFDGPPVHLVP